MCVCVSIKLKQPTMWLATFFSNLVIRWNGHFFNSLNKMTNAAYENAMRRCPRNYFFGLSHITKKWITTSAHTYLCQGSRLCTCSFVF